MDQETLINVGLYGAYGLVGLAALSTILLPLINSLSDPKTLIWPLIGIVFLGIVSFVGYNLASSEVTETYAQFNVDSEGSMVIGGAIKSMYILVGVALFGIIFTEITKIFK